MGDFDFFVGSWEARNRRLTKPLADCDVWDEFGSTSECWSVFGGAGNIDELSVPERGFHGLCGRWIVEQRRADRRG